MRNELEMPSGFQPHNQERLANWIQQADQLLAMIEQADKEKAAQ